MSRSSLSVGTETTDDFARLLPIIPSHASHTGMMGFRTRDAPACYARANEPLLGSTCCPKETKDGSFFDGGGERTPKDRSVWCHGRQVPNLVASRLPKEASDTQLFPKIALQRRRLRRSAMYSQQLQQRETRRDFWYTRFLQRPEP